MPRRIAHLTTVDLSLRHLLLAQIRGSLDAGDEVVGISARGPDVAFLESQGMRFVELTGSTRSMSPRGDLRAATALWRILRTERPDVLHTHTPKPGWYGRVLGRLTGTPLVVHTTHGLYAAPDDPWTRRAVVYALEAIASRFSHIELVQNPEDLALMHRLHLAPARKLRLLGNGVDLSRFRPPADGERDAVRSELGLDPDDLVVGLVARLVAEKGVVELVEASERLGRPFRLLLVGPEDRAKADAVTPALLDRARAAGAVLTGMRDDVERLYRAMDLFCLPSHREGFPRAAMEAAASGLPVVATDIRGCREVVDDPATGRLFPVGDVGALCARVRDLADPDTRAALGAAGRAKAEVELDERLVVARVLDAYDGR